MFFLKFLKSNLKKIEKGIISYNFAFWYPLYQNATRPRKKSFDNIVLISAKLYFKDGQDYKILYCYIFRVPYIKMIKGKLGQLLPVS